MRRNSFQNPHTASSISTDRNRWFIASVIMFFALMGSVWDSLTIRTSAIDRDIMWVRIFPNATWDVTIDDLPNEPEAMTSVVDKLLWDFTRNRYQVVPFTISDDYGAANVFLSESLSLGFLGQSETDFNAPAKVKEAVECGLNCFEHRLEFQDVTHYDADVSELTKQKIYRSNIFVKEFDVDPSGSSEKRINEVASIIDITWRILSKAEIVAKYPSTSSLENMREYLITNPLGMEIISYEKYAQTKTKN